jgi:hypothetical protein
MPAVDAKIFKRVPSDNNKNQGVRTQLLFKKKWNPIIAQDRKTLELSHTENRTEFYYCKAEYECTGVKVKM